MTRLYRLTHNAVALVSDDTNTNETNAVVNTSDINLSNLVMFSAVLFMTEFQKMGMGGTDVSKTCNMSEWRRRMYAGTGQVEDENIDIMGQPAKDPWNAGLIYATTTTTPDDNSGKERFTAFLFAHHKPALAKTMPATRTPQDSSASVATLSSEAFALVPSKGVTHIWLCGSDPSYRRHRYMSRCLDQLEKDVRAWKASGDGSGILTVHTIPAAFPGMVQFLLKNGFQGGDLVIGGENGKVLYWKEV